MTREYGDCTGCGEKARVSIQLSVDANEDNSARYYLPSYFVRHVVPDLHHVQEVSFCAECMRTLEDNLRATILGLQHEARRIKISPTE